jgi:hypothetical protein
MPKVVLRILFEAVSPTAILVVVVVPASYLVIFVPYLWPEGPPILTENTTRILLLVASGVIAIDKSVISTKEVLLSEKVSVFVA